MDPATEQQRLFELNSSRLLEQDAQSIGLATASIKPPSKWAYRFVVTLAVISDFIDFADLTGIGFIISYIYKIITTPIFFLYGYRANKQIKNMRKAAGELGEKIAHIKARILHIRSRYATAIRLGRKIRALRRPIRAIASKVTKFGGIVTRNPLFKNVLAIVAEYIPGLKFMPWQTIGIWLVYKDKLKSYREALPILEDYAAAKSEEVEMLAEEINIQAEEFEEEQVEMETPEPNQGKLTA